MSRVFSKFRRYRRLALLVALLALPLAGTGCVYYRGHHRHCAYDVYQGCWDVVVAPVVHFGRHGHFRHCR